MLRVSGEVVVRPSRPDADRLERAELVRRTWEVAYREIFSEAEIAGVFDGSLRLSGGWTERRTAPAGYLVAVRQDRLVGVAGLGLLEPGVGELAAFYVLPDEQGRGVGLRLWDAALTELRARSCERVEVWTLARAGARHFYEARGCRHLGEGVLELGGHAEPVLGYGLTLRPSAEPPREGDR